MWNLAGLLVYFLYARRNAVAMADSAWRPPLPAVDIAVAGRSGIATLDMMLVNMREGGMISAHDYRVAHASATALCGGDIETGARVNEQWLLEVERALFVDLLKTKETQARIAHIQVVTARGTGQQGGRGNMGHSTGTGAAGQVHAGRHARPCERLMNLWFW